MSFPYSGNSRSAGKQILVVEDHPIVRQGLALLINREADLSVCGEADNVTDAMALVNRLHPDLILLDLSLGSGDGTDLCKDLSQRQPGLPVLILSMHDECLYAERALRAGARGYLMKSDPPDHILAAIRRVLGGQIYLSEKMALRLLDHLADHRAPASLSPLDRLSDRELQVFRLIGQGLGVRRIAQDLYVSPKTVEAHREHIKQKLQLASSTELIRYAVYQTMGQQ